MVVCQAMVYSVKQNIKTNTMISYIKYDTDKYNFVKVMQDLFETNDLSSLNEYHKELFKVSADSQTSFHTKFYDKYRSGWKEMEDLYFEYQH